MEVVAGDRIRSLVWVEELWNSWERSPKGLEVGDFSWRCPDPCEIFIGAVLPYDVHTFL